MLVSCKKEEPQLDPRKAILGKWEATHLGNGNDLIPIENPIAYQQYLPDSVLLTYNYEEETFSYEKYWLTDSLLITSFVFIDNIDKDTVVFKFPYKYDFITPSKLKLEFQYLAIFRTSIYKRLN
jgi:hypothetical protein